MNTFTQITVPLSYHMVPLISIAGYLAYPKQLRINPSTLHALSVIHNALLILFSAWTFLSLSQILYNNGVVFQYNYYFNNPVFDRIIYLFYLSKYYEFFDTFLLYLNGKTPIFLQKYHHIGAVINWHLAYFYKADGIWLPSLINSLIHTIMYSYYLGCLLKINQVRFIKQYITTLQLIQFFVSYALLYLYKPPIETWFNYYIMIIFAFYAFGLIMLFGKFYYDTYICKKLM
jgi:hypothetical protein